MCVHAEVGTVIDLFDVLLHDAFIPCFVLGSDGVA